MTRACSTCRHAHFSEVQGRDRIGCMRPRKGLDGQTLTPPKTGWEAVAERLPQSHLDWRAPGDKCGPEAKNWRQA